MSFSLHRISGHVALDLANTISWRDSPAEIDHLARFEDAMAWCRDAGILTPRAARRVAAAEPALRDRILTDLRRLRGIVYAIGGAVADGTVPPEAPRAALVAMLRNALAGAVLEPAAPEPLRLSFAAAEPRAAMIGPLAWAALDLFRQDLAGRLKQCPPDDCRWLFIDTTKNRSRRWCDMASCGNRAKVHRHRQAALRADSGS
ncbi:CGNR zinc finger domain-containing protein [Plastoroseomonas hellenica]|uniref:CGNR zinc finger domain-containing protein n=1 Tax=Plastoroseomonas hellenica TaxID=2687306 RepID=UPI001BA47C37|nr:CGNR zinc finger domain-containing protein [Plastoroseomonas hellenica]MBR0645336.1 hypothetical protein [Plastoroseomonas hellenica]